MGILPTVATRFFPRVVLRFGALRPDMVLAVETGPHHYLMRLLREGGIDLMIGRLPGASEMAGLSFDHLYEEDVVLVGRAGHPLAQHPVAEALVQAPVILPAGLGADPAAGRCLSGGAGAGGPAACG